MSETTGQFTDIEEFYQHLAKIDGEEELAHVGTPRHSGRYPWGSGEDPYQRHKNFLEYVKDMKNEGMKEGDIVKALGLKSSADLRAMQTIAVTSTRQAEIDQIRKLHDKGMSATAIAKQLGYKNESTVRARLNPALAERANRLTETADFLKKRVDEEGYIDVGTGIEHYLGVSNTKKQVAIGILKDQGYQVFYHKVPTHGDKETNVMVLARPDKTYQDLKADPSQIKTIAAHYDPDSGTFRATLPPVNFPSKRIGIRYAEDGGADMDGVIQLRRGVEDLSLNGKAYAQVRIAVDGTHYLKGMAMYADKMPDGVDMVFNTNKSNTGNKLDAMKKLQKDDENPDYIDEKMPFGSMVTQNTYIDKKGKQQLSPLNRVGSGESVNEEGRWNQWSRTFSSQMLSKQSPQLAKQQLDLTFQSKRDDLDDILALTNPAVKKKLLEEFADGADSSAVHLKAAGLPRTRNQVILPINSLKDGEVYAPNFRHGEKVVLIRHPHGGIFEIPELVVNNKNKEALSVLKQAKDAVGINSKVAERLSGADFDGDTVLVIPNNDKKIKTSPPLDGLKNFDPKVDYAMPKDSHGDAVSNGMTPKGKQKEMGVVSNLITDMTIKKASHAELARAVRHSMVVIDAEKHNLDYKRSEKDNGIAQLKKKYQFDPETGKSGASTIISRAKSQAPVLDRKPRSAKDGGPIDPVTGEKMWTYTGETYTKTKVNKRTGQVTEVEVAKPGKKSSKMAEARDAHELSSGTLMETVYADHANRLKSLANQARKQSMVIKPVAVNPLAKKTYEHEVASLKAKLNVAQKNAPLERQARIAAKATADAKKKANPQATNDQLKKAYRLGLEEARMRLGAKKEAVTFTEREWEAVQNNAISTNVLNALLANAQAEHIKTLATPRDRPVMTDAKMARAKVMLARGYTQSEIADALGVPGSTLSDALG